MWVIQYTGLVLTWIFSPTLKSSTFYHKGKGRTFPITNIQYQIITLCHNLYSIFLVMWLLLLSLWTFPEGRKNTVFSILLFWPVLMLVFGMHTFEKHPVWPCEWLFIFHLQPRKANMSSFFNHIFSKMVLEVNFVQNWNCRFSRWSLEKLLELSQTNTSF